MEKEERSQEQEAPRVQELFNPFDLPRPGREVHHETFRDAAQPGVVLRLSLRAPDAVDMARMTVELERMTELYITGSEEVGPGPFPLVGGQSVTVSRELFSPACIIAVMQAPPELSKQERRWEPEHLVAISLTMPNAWSQIMRRAEEIRRSSGRAEGNSSGPSMAH